MKHPQDLSKWSLATIRRIVRGAEFEPGTFDYKAVLKPTSNHDEHRKRIRNTVCSMANTNGGYILFGIKDRRVQVATPEDRIAGIPLDGDLPHDFGITVRGIRPDVHFDPMLKPVTLANRPGKGLWVVYVPRSPLRPHEVDGVFYKRVDGGAAERMHVNEVRDQMLLSEERIRRVILLRLELRDLLHTSKAMDRGMKGNSNLAFDRFDASTFKALIADTCAILPPSDGLLGNLLTIGRVARRVNETLIRLNEQYLRRWDPENPMNFTNPDRARSELHEDVRVHREELEKLCKKSEATLVKYFGPLAEADSAS